MDFSKDPALFLGLTDEEMQLAAEGMDEFLATFNPESTAVQQNPGEGDDNDLMTWDLMQIGSMDRNHEDSENVYQESDNQLTVQASHQSTSGASALPQVQSPVPELMHVDLEDERNHPNALDSNLLVSQGRRSRTLSLDHPPSRSRSRSPNGLNSRASDNVNREANNEPVPTPEHRHPPYQHGLGMHGKNLWALPAWREYELKRLAEKHGKPERNLRSQTPK